MLWVYTIKVTAARELTLDHHMRHFHLMGVGGIGMSALAVLLVRLGHTVSGCDLKESAGFQLLQDFPIRLWVGHDIEHLQGVTDLVCSAAIAPSKLEVQYALEHNIRVWGRAELLSALTRDRRVIAVTGTHGKTTTTSLITQIFIEAGLKPGFYIGGLCPSIGPYHADCGLGDYFIIEADESDRSLLAFTPEVSVMTNIDNDHLDSYGQEIGNIGETFRSFAGKSKAVLNIDDERLKQLSSDLNVYSFGFDDAARFKAVNIHYQQEGMSFQVIDQEKNHVLSIVTSLFGQHNVYNILAAITVAKAHDIDDTAIQKAISMFSGVGRRCQIYNHVPMKHGMITVVDDYGHHPRAIRATILALKERWPIQRLVLVYQPHRYTRTRDHFHSFVEALCLAHEIILLPVYAASEAPIQGAHSLDLIQAIARLGKTSYLQQYDSVTHFLSDFCKTGDVVLFQGAGDISQLVSPFVCHVKAEEYNCYESTPITN
jgi:UDP-N-acetylmuramate--alanine ligase